MLEAFVFVFNLLIESYCSFKLIQCAGYLTYMFNKLIAALYYLQLLNVILLTLGVCIFFC